LGIVLDPMTANRAIPSAANASCAILRGRFRDLIVFLLSLPKRLSRIAQDVIRSGWESKNSPRNGIAGQCLQHLPQLLFDASAYGR
jgi:hypothetical protein